MSRRQLLGIELTRSRATVLAVALLVVVLLPFLVSPLTIVSYRSIFSGLTFGIAAVGVALLLRYLHLVSFGHAAFFGSGAYTVAVLASHLEISNLFVLLIAGVAVSIVAALVVGVLIKGHTAIFFALLTLAFNQIIFAVVKSLGFFNYDDGLSVRAGGTRPDVFGIELGLELYNLFLHYVTVVVIVVGLYVVWKIGNSPFGRTIKAIGDNRVRANFIGIDVERYVLTAFIISGIYAGIGGALFALFELHVRPGPTLHIFRSGEMLFMAILGGFETLVGPVVGGVLLTYMLDTMHVITNLFDLLSGLILIAVVFLLPHGVMGVDYTERAAAIRNDPSVVVTWVKSGIERI